VSHISDPQGEIGITSSVAVTHKIARIKIHLSGGRLAHQKPDTKQAVVEPIDKEMTICRGEPSGTIRQKLALRFLPS
jgi:hypothetical protein